MVTPRVGLRPGGQRAPVPCTQAPPAQTCTRGIGKAARSKASGPHQQRVEFPAKGVKRKTLCARLKTTTKPLVPHAGGGVLWPGGQEGGSVRVWEVFCRNGQQAFEDSWARVGAVPACRAGGPRVPLSQTPAHPQREGKGFPEEGMLGGFLGHKSSSPEVWIISPGEASTCHELILRV